MYQNGGVYGMKFPAPKDRHWFTNHVMEEVKSIERGTLDMKRARILNTTAKPKTASRKAFAVYGLQFRNCVEDPAKYIVRSPDVHELNATIFLCVRSPLCGI